jgi:hypothetical protein
MQRTRGEGDTPTGILSVYGVSDQRGDGCRWAKNTTPRPASLSYMHYIVPFRLAQDALRYSTGKSPLHTIHTVAPLLRDIVLCRE